MNTNAAPARRSEPNGAIIGFREAIVRTKLTHIASVQDLDIDRQALSEAIDRTTEMCARQGIPVTENVMRVFLGARDTVQCAWLLSDLGFELLRQRILHTTGRR
jgi:hypothetical protein